MRPIVKVEKMFEMLETTLVMVERYLVTKVEPFEEGVAENANYF